MFLPTSYCHWLARPLLGLALFQDSLLSLFVGLAYEGKDIVFRFTIEYSSLRDFYRPLGNNNSSIFI